MKMDWSKIKVMDDEELYGHQRIATPVAIDMDRVEQDPSEWTSSEVAAWLRGKIESDKSSEWTDDNVNAYVDAFKANLVNGHSLMNQLDEDRLERNLGISVMPHRICILNWINEMRVTSL